MIEEEESFDSLFATEESEETTQQEETWKILIVDDEPDIHSVIKLALDGFTFQDKKISFLDAYSGEEAKKLLADNSDTAVILLDVVMETDDAGLNFVKFIRENLNNQFIRIVLWTGQPGHAPKKEVVLSYEINDYKTKTDLTDENIFTAVLASIRSYNAMMTIESYRQHLEDKVKERTKKIEEQKNKITDSISYAKRIQQSMLPSEKIIKQHFPDSFIFYRPKDIVSGDFYWFSESNSGGESDKPSDTIFIAAADCTGHGVPGAFMSMIGNTLLNEIVNSKKIHKPSDILGELNKGVIESLNQRSTDDDVQNDGMDITLCKIDKSKKELQIACANHVLVIINDSGPQVIEGDIYSIGGMFSVLQNPTYTNHVVPFDSNTAIYLFSDGFQDQFGGNENEKYMLSRLHDFFLEQKNQPMEKQLEILKKEFEEWKGNNRQIDDILVMGIKLNNK